MLPRVGALVVVAWLIPVFWLGGASSEPAGLTAIALSLALFVTAASSSSMLRNARPAAELLAATALLAAATLPAFLWLPASLRGALGDPRPGWAPLHGDVEAALPALVLLLLTGAFGALGAATGAQSIRRRDVVPALALVTAAVAAIALAHGLIGVRAQWGLLPPRHDPVRPFLPFVNPNHLGTLALLGLPAAVTAASDLRRGQPARAWAAAAAGVLTLAAIVSLSSAVWAIAAGLALVGLARIGRPKTAAAAAIGLAVVGTIGATQEASLLARLSAWKAGFDAWSHAPITGVGLGAFASAIEPYRTDHAAVVWGHAHSDFVEGLVETGVIGGLAAVGACLLLRPRASRPRSETWSIDLGVLAFFLHSIVDFPLHVPLLAGTAALAWGIRRAVFEVRRPVSARAMRTGLVIAATVLLAAAASSYRTVVCEGALRTLATGDLRAAATLRAWGWQGPQATMAELLVAPDPDAIQAMVSRWPDRADVWRAAAASHARLGQVDAALADLDRAEAAGPADWRTFAARGRLLAGSGRVSEAAGAWLAAFTREAPWQLVEEAYATMPIAVWWVDAFEDAPPHYAWALARAAMAREPESALLALDVADRARPGFYGPTRVEVLLTAHRNADAASVAERWLAANPTDAFTWAALAQARAGVGDTAAQIAALERATALLPAYRPALISAIADSGATAEAAHQIRAWSLRGDVAPEVYLALAHSLAARDDLVGCRNALDQVLPVPSGAAVDALRAKCAISKP